MMYIPSGLVRSETRLWFSTNGFVILTNGKRVVAVAVAVGQSQGPVVYNHLVPRNLAERVGIGAVGHGQGLCC